jgi:hypothetical protein
MESVQQIFHSIRSFSIQFYALLLLRMPSFLNPGVQQRGFNLILPFFIFIYFLLIYWKDFGAFWTGVGVSWCETMGETHNVADGMFMRYVFLIPPRPWGKVVQFLVYKVYVWMLPWTLFSALEEVAKFKGKK